jgi:hypothetical protein
MRALFIKVSWDMWDMQSYIKHTRVETEQVEDQERCHGSLVIITR